MLIASKLVLSVVAAGVGVGVPVAFWASQQGDSTVTTTVIEVPVVTAPPADDATPLFTPALSEPLAPREPPQLWSVSPPEASESTQAAPAPSAAAPAPSAAPVPIIVDVVTVVQQPPPPEPPFSAHVLPLEPPPPVPTKVETRVPDPPFAKVLEP